MRGSVLRRRYINQSLWILVLLACSNGHTRGDDQREPALVGVCSVVQQDVSRQSDFVATVMPVRRSVVGTAVDGRVERFLVDPDRADGRLTRVAAGHPLAQLRTDMVKRELAAAEAMLRALEQKLAELKNGARPEEIAAAEANQARWQAQRDFTKARLRRTRELFNRGQTVSRDQLDEDESLAVQAEQAFNEAKAQYELVVAGPREEKVAQAEAEVDGQRETVLRLQQSLEKHTIRARFNGYIVREFTEIGSWVKQGDPIAEVVQLDVVELEASVPEKFIPLLPLGKEIDVRIEAHPDRTFQGKIERIVPQADVRSRTFPVRIRVKNPEAENRHLLMAGMLGHVGLPIGKRQSAMLVPKDALVLGQRGNSVYRLNRVDDSASTAIVQRVPVEMDAAYGNLIAIRGGLETGDLVVIQGNERLRDGESISIHTRATIPVGV